MSLDLPSEVWSSEPEWERTYPRFHRDEPYFVVEPIPHGGAGINLRTRLTRHEWDSIRRYTYRRANFRCELCGGIGEDHPIECHEIWEWQIARAIPRQYLRRCAGICPQCHRARHIGHTKKTKNQHEYEGVVKHILHLNRWRWDQYEDYLFDVAERQVTLNHVPKWRLDILWARRLLKKLREQHANVDVPTN